MSVTWTREQNQVIQLRGRNILVSAAAGSGKTAVLVERIVQKVLDETHPVDIDRMLIVTFTKAAAAEMRERVGRAIERRLEREPDNRNLQRQYTLVHHAQITTIDSFCLYVVRNYFQMIGLEPSFRIADPGELQLLRADVAKEVMEEQYKNREEGFLRLADHYATAKSDAALVDFCLKLYDFSQSCPWPSEWLSSLAGHYRLKGAGQLDDQPWMQGLLRYLSHILADLKRQMEYACSLCQDADGPQMYLAAVQEDVRQLERLQQCGSFAQYASQITSVSYQKLGVNRKYEGSVKKQEQVKALRKIMKDTLSKLQSSYFYQGMDEMLADMQNILPDVEELAKLAQRFAQAYQARKKEKNLLDFSDIEHFALEILVDPQTKEPTAAAKELREQFEEIMIDEYQDSNYVQETILRAVAREAQGQNNIFMVGDVKQSIYRFRLARPELFIEKYKTYTLEESSRQRIDLHQNFRSRKEVVESVNHIFYKIMQEDLGNVAYDEKAALYCGASWYPPAGDGMFQSELLLVQASEEELAQTGMRDGREAEAWLVAARIKELLETQLVTDKESGQLRPARYGDVVILLRSISGWADTFSRVLAKAGIAAHTTSQTGYFAATEIQTVLSMLSILDNPLQDIPLAAVLASPIGGFDGSELAQVRAESKEHFYFLALEEYAQSGPVGVLREKCALFLQMYEKLRSRTAYTPIHSLIQMILQETGYASYIQAMPGGAQRRANMDMLLEKAIAYEKTSYKGLFHFVRYIEKLKKYEVDFGEADLTSENEDVVRIMSIHKSKGLEFPVVFVCGITKQFNRQDTRSRMILHPDYGVGLDLVDAERRVRKPGMIKKVLANQIGIDNQGEELRVLYVALTRAKEKLILTGAVKEEPANAEASMQSAGVPMDFFSRYRALSYLDWVYPCALCSDGVFHVQVYGARALETQEAVDAALSRISLSQMSGFYKSADDALYEQVDRKLSWHYPYEGDTVLKTKISVSELKRRAMEYNEVDGITDEDMTQQMFTEEPEPIVPAFLRSEAEPVSQGALRGSAVHKVMEEVDFVQSHGSKDRTADLRRQVARMLEEGHITPQMKQLVNPRMVGRFLDSPIAARMAQAQRQGDLYREQPFVMGIEASRLYEGASGELVLIQGIVDVYWLEEDEIIILDYKTDAVNDAGQLVKRYKSQLELYAQALEKATGKRVKEKMMYSFRLQEAVLV